MTFFVAGGLFLYFIWGATHNGIYIPGSFGRPDNTVQDGLAWVMCLAPILFFASQFVEFSSKVSLSESARKIWHWILLIAATLLVVVPVILE